MMVSLKHTAVTIATLALWFNCAMSKCAEITGTAQCRKSNPNSLVSSVDVLSCNYTVYFNISTVNLKFHIINTTHTLQTFFTPIDDLQVALSSKVNADLVSPPQPITGRYVRARRKLDYSSGSLIITPAPIIRIGKKHPDNQSPDPYRLVSMSINTSSEVIALDIEDLPPTISLNPGESLILDCVMESIWNRETREVFSLQSLPGEYFLNAVMGVDFPTEDRSLNSVVFIMEMPPIYIGE